MVSPHYQTDVIAFLKKQAKLSDEVMVVEVVKRKSINFFQSMKRNLII